jgi:hypothetical protein
VLHYSARKLLFHAVTAAEQSLATVNLDPFVAQLVALSEPATLEDISDHVALTIASFPNAKPANPEVFGRMLVEEVQESRPSIGALEAACRFVRRIHRFCPTIAEVVKALALTEDHLQGKIRTVQQRPFLVGLRCRPPIASCGLRKASRSRWSN